MAAVSLQDVAAGVRFLYSLVSHPSRRITLAEAHQSLRERLARREQDFLALVDAAIYRNPASPYLALLAGAGCERSDLERLVRAEGIEGALGVLYRQGVYLTVDELKGRRPVVRGSTRVTVEPHALRIPGSSVHVMAYSSGTRGLRTTLSLDVASLRVQGGNVALVLEARGADEKWVHAVWVVPSSAAIARLHHYQTFRMQVAHWFSQVDPAAPGLHPRYLWSTRLQRLGSLLVGVPLPAPRHVPVDDPLPIARWMVETLKSGRTPHLWTFPSSAVRLCQAARRAGLDLSGAQFTLTGEPMTPARERTIHEAGAGARAVYGSAEVGMLAFGCLAPADDGDDFHVWSELHALIEAGSPGPLRPRTLLVTSLRSTSRVMMLNVSLGDEGDLGPRPCGCPLERLGWTTHLRTVRSFEKLNAGGIALLDSDVVEILEETLPARFGGGPTDYQLLEEESADGSARLRLLVHPALGPLDEGAVADTFLRAVGQGSGVERLVELQWRQAGLPIVERRAPGAASSGKIHHLDQVRSGPG